MNENTLRILANSDPQLFANALKKYGLEITGVANSNPLNTRARQADIASIASELTEGIYDYRELNPAQQRARQIAEEAGYIIAITESLDDWDFSEYDEEDEGPLADFAGFADKPWQDDRDDDMGPIGHDIPPSAKAYPSYDDEEEHAERGLDLRRPRSTL